MGTSFARIVFAASVAAGVAVGGCVDGFEGSNVQIDFSQKIGEDGPLLAPADTYYTLYAVDRVFDETTGVQTAEYLFAVHDFELVDAIDTDSPCAIDIAGSPYPGLHITRFADKEMEQTGVTDPYQQGQDPRSVQRVLTAMQRVTNAIALQTVDAVTSTSLASYPGVAPGCVEDTPGLDPALIPPASCIGDASNTRRLAVCDAFWTANPLHYEGNDKVLTAPLGGELYGFVQGQNPLNGATLGGSQIFVDEVLDFDAYAINWQFKDHDGDGMPDYPASFPVESRTPTGVPFVSGEPEVRTRGVINVPMQSLADPSISANMAIFADIGNDPVQF
jgi:hypothetical protein